MRLSERQLQTWGKIEKVAEDGKRYYEDGKVKKLSAKIYHKDEIMIESVVEGNYCIPYTQKFILNRDNVTKAFCECPYMKKYNGCCRHIVAAGYRYLEEQEYWIEELESQTDQEVFELIDRYRTITMEQIMTEHVEGYITIEPILTVGEKISLTFRLGNRKKYIIKDIYKFIMAVQEGESISYGKSLTFHHNIGSFDYNSRRVVEFLISQISELEKRYAGYYSNSGKKDLYLSKYSLDEFMELLIGSKIVLSSELNEKKTMQIKKENPKLILDICQRTKKSYEMAIQPFEYFRGAAHLYIVNNGIIYQCDKQYTKQMEPFLSEMMFAENYKIKINERDMQSICAEVLSQVESYVEIRKENISLEKFIPPEGQVTFYLDIPAEDKIICRTQIKYGDISYNLFGGLNDKGIYRDLGKEFQIKKAITCFFPHWQGEEEYHFQENLEENAYELAVQGIPLLEQFGTIMATDKVKKLSVRSSPQIALGIRINNNLLELTMQMGEYEVNEVEKILSAYQKRKKYYRLKSGEFINLEEGKFSVLSELLETLQLSEKELAKGQVNLPMYRAMYLDKILEDNKQIDVTRDEYLKEMVNRIKSTDNTEYRIPNSLKSILRSYQVTGYHWLRTLAWYGFGGILADDMGLGKTLQAISMLLALDEEKVTRKEEILALIVCPASLVYNWENEIEMYAPQLTRIVITGNSSIRKKKIEEGKDKKIWITSFDLLRRDVAEYERQSFYCHIIDEAQFIKNHNTQIARASKKVPSNVRFAMTGTPIENKLSELWSIFDFLMPNYLYHYSKFKNEFEVPIVQNKDEVSSQRLRKMIAPFLLRRIKPQVLKELPEKVEQVIYTKLEGEQRDIYYANVSNLVDHLKQQTTKQYKENKIEVLAELTKLRQICCAPQLCYENYNGEQVKIQMALELIRNAIDGGHKILVFSQFRQLLQIMEKELIDLGYAYYKLTGSTKKEERIQYVEEFNCDEVPVFLISLKAGGTGLNLTAADIVIHLDPWWNIAAQNQATDRAHRIGQKKTVTVFYLIAKDTIEEKIMKMQLVKKDLTEEILGEGEIGTGILTREQLIEFLG